MHQTAWQRVADGTPYAAATTRIESDRMDAACEACAHHFRTEDPMSECPACGAMGSRMTGGDVFGLSWLSFADGSPSEASNTGQIAVTAAQRESTVQQEIPGAP